MDRGIAIGQAAPDVSARQQALVLCVLGRIHGFAGVVARRLGVLPAFHLFFQPGIGHLALQDTRAGHQDGIILLFAQGIGLCGLGVGVLQIAAIEVEQAAVFQHAADAVMMVVMAVDLLRLLQVSEGAAAKLVIFIAMANRPAFIILFLGLALAPALGLGVHLLADLQRDQPLHVSHVNQRAGQVAMLRITLAQVLNGPRKKLQRLAVSGLA